MTHVHAWLRTTGVRVLLLGFALVVGASGCSSDPSRSAVELGPDLDTSVPHDQGEAVDAPEVLAGPRFGVAVPGSDPDLVTDIETLAGSDVGVVRVFTRWDTPFPEPNHEALLDAGRTIHLSVRPRTDAGIVIPWTDVATAEPGSAVYRRLDEWTRIVASYGDQIYFTLNHEPETSDSAANGDAEAYVAAWRRMVELLRANGGEEVPTVMVLGRGPYVRGTADEWYAGDDVVDIVGVDPYNWYLCQGTVRPWRSPAVLIEPALEFAAAHGKPLAIPEVASTEDPDDPDRKAEWIAELGEYLASEPIAEKIEFVAWFSVHDRGWPDCEWEYDSSPQSADAFARLVADLNS